MNVVKKVLLVWSGMLLLQVCTTQSDAPPLKATFKSFDVNYSLTEVDVAKAKTITVETGTAIDIPEEAFVYQDNSPVEGNVKLEYREMHTAGEILASGTPLTYDGKNVESAGMFEIKGTVDGKPVKLADGKTITVKMVSEVTDNGYDLYKLENKDKKVSSVSYPFVSTAYARDNDAQFEWNFVKKMPPVTDETAAQSEIKMNDSTIVQVNEKKDSHLFQLKLNTEINPDLAQYQNAWWLYSGRGDNQDPLSDKNKWVLDEKWDNLEIVQTLFKPLATFSGHNKPVSLAVFSPDGSKILTASADGTAKLWNANGTLIASFLGHTKWIRTAVFSPDGSKILTASGDGTAKVWNLNGAVIQVLDGQMGEVYCATFSKDGQYIATGAKDNSVRLWSMDGKMVKKFSGHKKPVYGV